jgi:hypothetical protein
MIPRLGRYGSLPDVETEPAPKRCSYTHSLTYVYDGYIPPTTEEIVTAHSCLPLI